MNIIVYTDFTSGNVSFHKVDANILGNEDMDMDIETYAEACAPSNNCEWMVLADGAKIFADEEIVDSIKERIKPMRINKGFISKSLFLSYYIEEAKDFLDDVGIEYQEWWRDDEVEIRIDLADLDDEDLLLIARKFGIKDIKDLTYLIIY